MNTTPYLPENPHHSRTAPSAAYTAMRDHIHNAASNAELESLRTHPLMHKASEAERSLLNTGINYYKAMRPQAS